ncbi:hypothetical protein DPMN_116313 [Dreissena polymorpha]|uniref:Cadherin domain-containing protein n=1 Tax=Dreissena polymorpha TaxID=45954 RepID=A0A9D4KNR6_DREPO|nr:hypothetical protein DPMN_116313 [Dreissena polymorpha]
MDYHMYLFLIGILVLACKGQPDDLTVNFEVLEEREPVVYLGNLVTEVKNHYNTSLAGYTFQTNSGPDYFSLKSNGNFTVVRRIDRENLHCEPKDCKLMVNAISISPDNSDFKQIKIFVIILDLNDNYPVFSPSSHSLSIPEGTAYGNQYELPSVVDKDSGNNSISQIVIDPPSENFRVENHKNLDGSYAINLVINQSPDRETMDSYLLIVKAIDGGNPPKTGTMQVRVNITDINDNRPVFEPNAYNVTIDETISVNSDIVRVIASDRDIGENGRIAYRIVQTDPATIADIIAIREASGVIFLNKPLISQPGPFSLYVEAEDQGDPPKKSLQSRVVINVRDVNNNAPEIKSISPVPVSEDARPGALVALIYVQDADTGVNGEVVCTCENPNFTIREGLRDMLTNLFSFSVHVNAAFDRELRDRYEVLINCSDRGEIPLFTHASLNVTILDVNDNAPRFSVKNISVDVLENVNVGAVLVKVSASDRDIGRNSFISYSIQGFSDMFYTEPVEGGCVIRSLQPFDREIKNLYEFTIIAYDNGTIRLNDTATVTVYIRDVNDNAPKFSGDSYAMAVLENFNISTSIGQVTALDRDLAENGKVSYVIPSEYPSEEYPFAVLDDGTVITKAILDRETKNLYKFEILASDHGNPPISTRVPVMVTVRDVNDNAPLIEIPDLVNNSISISENTQINTIIYTVIATDADENQGGELIYSYVSGNSENLFYINANNGEISLTRKIALGDPKEFSLMISVKDRGVPPMATTRMLHVSFHAPEASATGVSTGSTGTNIIIVSVIAGVTLVLSVIIITIICIVKRKDTQKRLYNAKAYDEQKIIPDVSRSSNRSNSSRGSRDKMLNPSDILYMENPNGKKSVSFSVEGDQDTGISLDTSGHIDQTSTFKGQSNYGKIEIVPHYENYKVSPSAPPGPDHIEDTRQREIHRMTSLRVHQALVQSNNNNNNSKQWPQSPTEENGYWTFPRRTSTNNVAISTKILSDELRSPNTSTSHPFYTSDSQQPSFSSFHGNNVHKTGPVLSAFLKKKQHRRNSGIEDKNNHSAYVMNDLSRPHHAQSNAYSYGPQEVNESPKVHNNFNFETTHFDSFGQLKSTLDGNPLLHSSKQSNLDLGNSFENGSVTNRSQDDDNTTTTSGSYTINDIHDDILTSEVKDMFYKPDSFV